MARLLLFQRSTFNDGDFIVRRIWEIESGGIVLALSYIRRTLAGHERLYGIDEAHGQMHEHHGPWRVPVSMPSENLIHHFDRVVRDLRRWIDAR